MLHVLWNKNKEVVDKTSSEEDTTKTNKFRFLSLEGDLSSLQSVGFIENVCFLDGINRQRVSLIIFKQKHAVIAGFVCASLRKNDKNELTPSPPPKKKRIF